MSFETVENGSTTTYARVVRLAHEVIRLANACVLKHGSNCGLDLGDNEKAGRGNKSCTVS
jgi:hypothetical protein